MATTDTVLGIIKGVLPFIGTALGGPLGAGAASFIASKLDVPAADVNTTLTTMLGNPADVVKLKAMELEYQEHCIAMGYKNTVDLEAINAQNIAAVNTTMQAEAKSEHWPVYSWRPFNGFLFGVTIFGVYFLLPLCKVPVPTVPEFVWMAWGGILGVASWFRGKMQAGK